MGARSASMRVIGTALAVLYGLGASGSAASDGRTGEPGPIRQWVSQRAGAQGSADAQLGPVTRLRTPLLSRSHAREGAIAGAVVVGVLSGLYVGAMASFGCQDYPDKCDDAAWLAAAGAAGGALVGGAVGALIGSQFELKPTIPPASSPQTRVKLFPRRGGVGIAVSHSF